MSLTKLLNDAQHGICLECTGCPWNPRNTSEKITFGASCKKHGFDWDKEGAVSVLLIRHEPANSAPVQTGVLCPICNNRIHNTADYHIELWKTTVTLDAHDSSVVPDYKTCYWTNSIMHGADKNGGLRDGENEARKKCGSILKKQIEILQPKFIISCGKPASESLYALGLITKRWESFKDNFSKGAYIEEHKSHSNLDDRWIICTNHGSRGDVNRNLAKYYKPIDFDRQLQEKLKQIPNTTPILMFLKKYNDSTNNLHNGLRVMLLHWLYIGLLIRNNYQSQINLTRNISKDI